MNAHSQGRKGLWLMVVVELSSSFVKSWRHKKVNLNSESFSNATIFGILLKEQKDSDVTIAKYDIEQITYL